jgi:chorismate synthase
MEKFGIASAAHVVQVGSVKSEKDVSGMTAQEIEAAVAGNDLFCLDDDATIKMIELIKAAWQEGDSLGGIVEVVVDGLPVGLGSYTQWDRRLDGQLAQGIMSIQAMKAVAIGDGVEASTRPGSTVHDALYEQKNGRFPFQRQTNRAGGLEGGMTNGERLIVRAYMKPIPTMRKGLDSLSFPEFDAHKAHYERSDVCAIAAASVVCRAMVCLVLANAFLDKFAGDSIADLTLSFQEYEKYCREQGGQQNENESLPNGDAKAGNDLEPEANEDAVGEF